MTKRACTILAASVGATVGFVSGDAGAVSIPATLQSVTRFTSNGSLAGNLGTPGPAWSYETTTGVISQVFGTFNARFSTSPTTTIFRHSATGLVLGGAGQASASTFECIEGNFGRDLGVNICGNYSLGGNYLDESTVSWGPGGSALRNLGGDDFATGTPRGIAEYASTRFGSWNGVTLTLSNAFCDPGLPGGVNDCAASGGFNAGYTWQFNALWFADESPVPQPTLVPVPPAAWLFGSALASTGWLRRRAGPASHR